MKCLCATGRLKHSNAESHTGYGCNSCGGSWLPYSYVKSISTVKEFDPAEFRLQLLAQAATPSAHLCLGKCGQLQQCTIGESQLAYCPKCLGIWFEKGQLKALLSQYRTNVDGRGEIELGWGVLELLALVLFK